MREAGPQGTAFTHGAAGHSNHADSQEKVMPRVLLEVTGGQSTAKRTIAEPGQIVRLGRDETCDLSFPLDTTVSREHCRIEVHDETVTLSDSSTYGITLNGETVTSVEVSDGDRIGFGHDIVVRVLFDTDDPDEDDARSSIDYLGPTASLSSLLQSSDESENDTEPVGYQIEFLSDQTPARVLKLPLAQAVVIGRLPSCDIHISTDPAVSRRHCRIAWQSPELKLESLGTHGSRLNGNPVEDAVLADGDELEIGAHTRFRISIVYPGDSSGATETSEDAVVAALYEEAGNGLAVCQVPLPEEATILTELRKLYPDHLALMVLDCAKSGAEIEGDLDVEQYLLCNRYPQAVLSDISPILPSTDIWASSQFIRDLSGSDAYVLVLSRPDSSLEDIIEHLRKLADMNPSTGQPSGGQTLFAYWWPSILSAVCRNCPVETAETLMTGIDAIAFEVDQGEAVEIVSSPEVFEQLESKDGIRIKQPARQ